MKRKCYIFHVETENFIKVRWSGRLKKFIPRGATGDEAPDSSPPVGDSSSISPSDQNILVALEPCVFLTYTLPSLTHAKATRPGFAIDFTQNRSSLLCLVRCLLMYTGARVKMSEMSSLNPLSLSSSL